jgi:NSS family neurotransmitter:Na+ symporter
LPAWLNLKYAYQNGQVTDDVFAVAEVIKVMALQRTTDIYGPIPVSNFGQTENPYESQETVYKNLLTDLNAAIVVLKEYAANAADARPLQKVDAVYQGDYTKWLKLANSVKLIGWHSAFMLLNFVVVAGGITGGIERANKILMPALFAILLILLGYGMVAADLPAAFRFMFHFEPAAISAKVILAAMGHAFFTLSLGMGAIMTYGSYLGRETPIGRTCLYIGAADTAIALLAGLSIFAIVFAQGLEPAAGPGLILQTLPIAFSQMPFGGVIGVLFFLLVVFAAWTSSISLIEPPSALLIERFGLRRPVAVGLVCLAAWLLGMAVALSFNDWGHIKLFGLNIFDLLDTLTTKIMMPTAGLLIALFVGWRMQRAHVEDEIALSAGGFKLWFAVLTSIADFLK